jgi:hypothetical protein
MPDSVEKLIYKLEIDGSGYIQGVESLSASTARFTKEQEAANATLKTNEAALKANTDRLARARKDLEDYNGTNARYRKQLENDVKSAEKDQQQLTQLVDKNRIAYEKATQAASDFANVARKATEVQGGAGRVPVPSAAPSPVIPNLQQALNNISLGDLPDTLERTIPEFEALRKVIGLAEERMKSLNAEDEEFKQLEPIVAKGKEALTLYDDATKKTTGSQQSLRAQLRQAREELVRLEQAGKGATKEYFELEKQTAKLTDEFADQQQRIKILSSDTKALDFGKGAITAATSAFQAYTSIAILAGDESQELQKKTMQLFAAMQLLQAVEEICNLTRREGVLATLAQSAAQSVYTAVVGTSTGALKAFRIALASTGILAAVAAIGYLVVKYNQMKEAAAAAAEKNKLLNEVREKAIDGYAKEVSKLEVLRIKLSTLSTPQNERIRLAKEYNTTADETNRIDLKQIGNIDLLNAAIDRQIVKIKERALAQAAANVTEGKAQELFKAEEKLNQLSPDFVLNLENIDEQIEKARQAHDDLAYKRAVDVRVNGKLIEQSVVINKGQILTALQDIKKANDEFNRSAKLTATIAPPQTCPEGYHWDATKNQCVKNQTTTSNSTVENVFEQERQKQRERLAELNRKAIEDERTIRKQFEEQLKSEQKRIDGLLKDKKLTKPQAETLKVEAAKINTVELNKALEDFNKKIADARKKLNDELKDLQNKSIQDSINLVQDEFQRRSALIEFNEQKEIQDARDNIQDRLDALELDRLLIGEENYQAARAEIVDTGEQNILNITEKYANERQDLSADIFKKALDTAQKILDEQLTEVDEETAEKIKAQKRLLDSGAINYEQFQKAITKIQKDEKAKRDKARLEELRAELDAINARLEAVTNEEEKEQLQARQRSVRGQIAEIESKVDTTDPGEKKKETLTAYVESVGQLTDAVISFWQKANEAEQKALDRSIEIQQKRVDAAQRIAERGNAQYLKEEEDRLKELEIKRENAARRQLAIDAALQASQILVAITGAVAKIATPGIGIAETIASIAVIVGSLATGYGLVKSLQGNQPRLAEGTTFVQRGKNPSGKDTIPAWLNEGEAVVPTETNKQYRKSIEAIYHGKVPANVMNTFVENYVSNKIKPLPTPNYEKIKHTAEMSVTHDGRLASMVSDQNRLIAENNDLQRQTLRAMKNMSVSANIDRNGVAIMVNEFLDQMEIDKRI